MQGNLEQKLAILVVSCDKYSDLWGPFFEVFWQFWPDCPFRVYLISNKKKEKFANVINIVVGEDKSWSSNLLVALKQVKEDFVLMHLEDLFFYKKIDTVNVIKLVNWFIQFDANYIRLNPTPAPDKRYNDVVGEVAKGSIYRVSTVMSVWKKSVLQDLLNLEENAWEFEIYGTRRADKYGGFFATFKPFLPVLNGVIKGKWQGFVLRKIQSFGIELNLKERKVMTIKDVLKLYFFIFRSKVLKCFPVRYQRKLKECFSARNMLIKLKK